MYVCLMFVCMCVRMYLPSSWDCTYVVAGVIFGIRIWNHVRAKSASIHGAGSRKLVRVRSIVFAKF